jgi:Kef-type K+ transport system membrane component KefB
MTAAIIITTCILFLLAYAFDLTSARTKVPSVILLLLLGFVVRELTDFFGIFVPDLTSLLPIFGTIGLILIVLEGSLELELNRSKFGLIRMSLMSAFIPLIGLTLLLTFLFMEFGGASFRQGMINAVPISIISSAIAIPSVKNIPGFNREFVIYESSLSDIMGVLLFNFLTLNENFGIGSFGKFGMQLVLISAVSFVATIGLAFLLNRIDHPIKFAPIILLVFLIYELSKVYHLPALLFILLFGLFLGNLDELKRFHWIEKLKPYELDREVRKFKDLTVEATFLVRSFFFLLFGFSLQTPEILNPDTWVWAVGIVVAVYTLRAVQLKVFKLPLSPLLYIAPRGLITILLFLAIAPEYQNSLVNKSLITQLIVLTALIMMFGMITNKKQVEQIVEKDDV